MKPSSKRVLSLLASVVFFIGTLVSYVKFIQPAYKEVDLLRGQLEAKRRQYNDYEVIIKKLRPIFDSIQSAAQLQEVFSSILPTNPMVPQAMAQLNGLANENLISINSIDVNELAVASQKTTLLKGLGTVDFKLTLNGATYEGLKRFLDNLESNIRIFDIKKISITKKPNLNTLDVAVEVYAYYQVQ